MEKYKKKPYKSYKFKISAQNRNNKFELPDQSYSVSYIHDYFEYIIKEHETVTDNPQVRINVNQIESRIAFQIKGG